MWFAKKDTSDCPPKKSNTTTKSPPKMSDILPEVLGFIENFSKRNKSQIYFWLIYWFDEFLQGKKYFWSVWNLEKLFETGDPM